MKPTPPEPAALSQPDPNTIVFSGAWTALGLGPIEQKLASLPLAAGPATAADGAGVTALDTAGAWVMQQWLHRERAQGRSVTLHGMRPSFEKLAHAVQRQVAEQAGQPAPKAAPPPSLFERAGNASTDALEQGVALLSFVGETALCLAQCIAHPSRLRWRPILYNIRSAGFDALPIVGLLSFLLGVVVAYQSADQLRQYGANIYVVDLVGVSMLREFAPLITAIIVAGRSGSAYAAQIGTMAVTEEIDAMRTLGIRPLEMLVLPKIVALVFALPLLTVFADLLGVVGGMLMGWAQLGVSAGEFVDRFPKAVETTTLLVGIGKAPVFAAIIVTIGCFQGFRTKGGADSVGRQTTRSVVQSIFFVIVADALFSVAFSALDL